MVMADRCEVAVLAGAQGKLALFLASLLQRAGVTPMAEFAALLEVFAQTVGEADPAEAAVLAEWAKTIGACARH
jgi:hypothetical protein